MFMNAQVQLSEAIIWNGIDNNNKKRNNLGTLLLKYTLPAHNIAIGLGILISYQDRLDEVLYWVPLLVGIVFYGLVLKFGFKRKDSTLITTSCEEEGNICGGQMNARLIFPFDAAWYPLISFPLALLCVAFYGKPRFPFVLIYFLFYTFLLFVTSVMTKARGNLGSFWCWTASFFSPLLFVVVYLYSEKYKDELDLHL